MSDSKAVKMNVTMKSRKKEWCDMFGGVGAGGTMWMRIAIGMNTRLACDRTNGSTSEQLTGFGVAGGSLVRMHKNAMIHDCLNGIR